MVSINLKPAARTDVDSAGQRHLLPMSTVATVLRGVCGIDSHDPSTGPFCLVGEKLRELRPSRILDTFCQAVVVNHPVDLEVLDGNYPEAVDDPSALLMSKVAPAVGDSLMDPRDNLPGLLPLWSPVLGFRELPLLPGQVLLVLAEELGSRDGFSGREGGEGEKAYINAYGFIGSRQRDSFRFTGETDEPFAGGSTPNGAGLGRAFQRPMKDDSELADLGELQSVAFEFPANIGLRESEAVVALKAPEARVSRLFSSLYSSKEGFKGQVNTHSHVLKNLGMDNRKRRPLLFQFWEGVSLGIVVERFLSFFPSCLSLLQEVIVEPTALVQGALKLSGLFFGWPDPELERFKHDYLL